MSAPKILACGLALLAGFAGVAHAQRVGTYAGQEADGSPISISLSRFRGALYVTEVQLQQYTVRCGDGSSFSGGTFFAGLLSTVTSSSVQVASLFPGAYLGASLSFDDATRSVSGFLELRIAGFASASGAPVRSTLCKTPNQAFAAVLGQKAAFDPNVKFVTYGTPP